MSDRITVQSLDHLVLSVRDIVATLAFYTAALGMEQHVFHPADGTTRHALKFGQQKINLHDAAAPFAPFAAQPRPGSADLCFLSDRPLADWLVHFEALNVPVEMGPVARTGATGAIMSLYVRDPDGNLIEIGNRMF
jgi:catechol 2,3-dioxygenase-like lactoylglutathione lyase family enzyme